MNDPSNLENDNESAIYLFYNYSNKKMHFIFIL